MMQSVGGPCGNKKAKDAQVPANGDFPGEGLSLSFCACYFLFAVMMSFSFYNPSCRSHIYESWELEASGLSIPLFHQFLS
jgi:hypothetical protein